MKHAPMEEFSCECTQCRELSRPRARLLGVDYEAEVSGYAPCGVQCDHGGFLRFVHNEPIVEIHEYHYSLCPQCSPNHLHYSCEHARRGGKAEWECCEFVLGVLILESKELPVVLSDRDV